MKGKNTEGLKEVMFKEISTLNEVRILDQVKRAADMKVITLT